VAPDNAILHEQKAQVLLEVGDAWHALTAATSMLLFSPLISYLALLLKRPWLWNNTTRSNQIIIVVSVIRCIEFTQTMFFSCQSEIGVKVILPSAAEMNTAHHNLVAHNVYCPYVNSKVQLSQQFRCDVPFFYCE
jgi:hypothetical protein